MARALELKLTHEGFEAKSVFNGESALEMIDNEAFDLILCDLVIPKMDGFQLLAEIKAKKISTPVVVLSNLSQETDKKKVMSLGAKDFFVKSDTPIAHIVDYIKNVLK